VEHNPLKQRLIGAIVLVALAVIFIPMLLDGGGEEGVSFGSNIPPKPADQRQVRVLKLHDMPKPPERQDSGRALIDKDLSAPPPAAKGQAEQGAAKAPAKSSDAGHADATSSQSQPNAGPESGGKTDAKASADAPAPKAWAVQVGSFTHRSNALALRDRLRGKHFAAFVDAVPANGGTVYRVRVGPEVRRADAEALQKRLDKHIKGKTLVVSHP